MLSLALLDQVLHIDTQKQQITVQAGARVQEVAHAYIKQDMLFCKMLMSPLYSEGLRCSFDPCVRQRNCNQHSSSGCCALAQVSKCLL